MPVIPPITIPGPTTIPTLDALAVQRDSGGLGKYLTTSLAKSRPGAFDFLKEASAYGVGRYGWHVYELREVGSGAVDAVFSTPLTCEDIGEQVYRWDGTRLTGYIPEAQTFGIRLVRHAITARFKPDQKWAGLVDKVRFEQTSSAASFQFRLADHFEISSILDAAGQPVPFASAGGVVSVASPTRKGNFEYTIRYSGTMDLPQYAGSVSPSEIMLSQDYWYPTVGRRPAPYTLTSYTPKGWKVIGQGVLSSQKESGDEVESTFRMDLPVVFYSFSSAPFEEATDRIAKWKISTYAQGESMERLHAENEVQGDVISFYDQTYSPYPFSSWSTVISPRYGGGALEAYSYTTWGSFPEEDAHEPSHTWWGGLLPNSYLHSEWNESFAVFSEGFFQRERDLGNRDERRKAFITDANPDSSFDAATVSQGGPEVGAAAGSLGYGKGAFVLQMLEDELGTPTFLKCLHAWLRERRAGALVEWQDFESVVDRETGKNYGWFFNEWLNRPGWPNFEIKNIRYKSGAITASVGYQGAPYRITIEALIRFSDGTETIKRVVVGGSGSLRIPVAKRPTLVSFDPWRRLLRVYHPDEVPLELRSTLHGAKRYLEPAHAGWAPTGEGGETAEALPQDLDGLVITGSPESNSLLRPLFRQVGFSVSGDRLTYRGTTVDLRKGGAFAIVDLPGGGHCTLAMGKTIFAPNVGRAKVCLVDQYGRFLRGYTPPKTSGWMVAQIGNR